MKKVYKISLTGVGIDEFIKGIDDYKKWLEKKTQELLQRLADEGLQVASTKFAQAVYDGTNDVSVSIDERDEHTKAIVATGGAVLFIEFGTGVTYPDDHPDKPAGILGRGEYGHQLGRLASGWRYPESHGAGSFGEADPDHPGFLHTYGNPANMSMYDTVKYLRENLPRIAKEVFGRD